MLRKARLFDLKEIEKFNFLQVIMKKDLIFLIF